MIDESSKEARDRPLMVFIALAVTLLLGYYVIVLLHEYGHGTTAWLLGYKSNPFEIQYGGWLLLDVDEAVPYDSIIEQGHGTQAALIGISGYAMNIVLLLVSVFALSRRQVTGSPWFLAAFYWSQCLI